MYFDRTFLWPHLISILIAVGFLVAAVRRPRLARKLYLGLFVYASLVNATVCLIAPESYVSNARFALLELYRQFIVGWFAEHVTWMVGSIALGQALIAAGLALGGHWARLALLGSVAFFVGIAPLGVGSAFPSSLIWAAGALWLAFESRARAALIEPLWHASAAHGKAHTVEGDTAST